MRWIIPFMLCVQVVSSHASAAVTIVEASYGADETFVDVSTRVRSLLSSGANEFRVANDTMGGDPIFGKVKSLRLVYRDESGTHEATVKEGETFRLGGSEKSQLPAQVDKEEATKPKRPTTASGWTFVDSAPSASAIRKASLQEVDTALALLDRRTSEQKGLLRVKISKSVHLAELYELWRDHPYGFLDPEIDGMARAQAEILTKEGKLYGGNYDAAKAEELSKQCDRQMNALVNEANLWIARRNNLVAVHAKNQKTASDELSDMFEPVESSMPSIDERRENVKKGRVPLTRTELDSFLRGNPLSSMAFKSEEDAWIMAEVMTGLRPDSQTPEDYGGMPRGNSQRSKSKRRQWERDKAYRAAVAAGPAAEAQFLQGEKTEQSLRNIEMQQMQLRSQLDQLQWQQQNRNLFGW